MKNQAIKKAENEYKKELKKIETKAKK